MFLVEYTLDTTEWGRILLARPSYRTRKDTIWGDLAAIEGTPWGDNLPLVPGEILSHALHGHATPLMRIIGPPPTALLKKIPDPYRQCCLTKKQCILYRPEVCQPCPKMPDCYMPANLTVEQQQPAAEVALAWKEGRYVILVDGAEFSL